MAPPVCAPAADPPSSVELHWLCAVLGFSFFLRAVLSDHSIPGTLFGSQLVTFRDYLAVHSGQFWTQWWALFRHSSQCVWDYDSPLLQALAVLIDSIASPGLHNAVWYGAVLGTLGVASAWWLGRQLFGPSFALLWAGLLAVSPLYLAWSRLGYRVVAAPPHIFIGAGLAYWAGRRRSLAGTLLAGVVTYLTVYNYEAARLAFALTPLAALAGGFAGRTAGAPRGRLGPWLLSALVLGTSLACTAVIVQRPLLRALWPDYPGYVGNRAESSLADLWKKDTVPVLHEFERSVGDYFVRRRSLPPFDQTWRWGFPYGGLVLLPVILLGLFGLLVFVGGVVPKWPLNSLWIGFLLAGGIALPSFACSTGRRFIIFDLAWQALAAFGILYLAYPSDSVRSDDSPGSPFSNRPWRLASALIAGLGLWSLGLLAALKWYVEAQPPVAAPGGYFIPFGVGCVGDIVSCPRCVELGTQWSREIAAKTRIVLMDSDRMRENETGPCGLYLDGELAAMKAGRPEGFIPFYGILENFTRVPMYRTYYPVRRGFSAWWRQALLPKGFTRTIWQAERPNVWDRWFAGELVKAGGTMETFTTPLSRYGGFRVSTSRALDQIVAERLARLRPHWNESEPEAPCFHARQVAEDKTATEPWMLLPTRHAGAWRPAWNYEYAYTLFRANGSLLEGVSARAFSPTGEPTKIEVVDAVGSRLIIEPETQSVTYLPMRSPHGELGFHCGARFGDTWWFLDPETGDLSGNTVPKELASEKWMGLARGKDDSEMLLLSPNQELVGFDFRRGKITFRVPAPVLPNAVNVYGECSQIVASDSWIGVLDQPAGEVTIYSRSRGPRPPRKVGMIAPILRVPLQVMSAAAEGPYLGLGYNVRKIETYQIDVSGCSEK